MKGGSNYGKVSLWQPEKSTYDYDMYPVKNNAPGLTDPAECITIVYASLKMQNSYGIICISIVTGYIDAAVRKSSTHPDFPKSLKLKGL
jgi:hypothetical protein